MIDQEALLGKQYKKRMATKSLKAKGNELAQSNRQLAILNGGIFKAGELPYFKDKIGEIGHFPLRPKKLEILQINVGYMCNQVCEHCHVDAGPDRKEIMTRETMVQCLEVIKNTEAHTLDLTGGAPEMNPEFRWFVEEAAKAGIKDFIVGRRRQGQHDDHYRLVAQGERPRQPLGGVYGARVLHGQGHAGAQRLGATAHRRSAAAHSRSLRPHHRYLLSGHRRQESARRPVLGPLEPGDVRL